jgi:hypothetical protein
VAVLCCAGAAGSGSSWARERLQARAVAARSGVGDPGRGMRMVWLISGLLLALCGGLAVVTRWGGRRPAADDTLVTELLGPPPARPRPAPPAREDAAPPPARPRPAPPAREDAAPPLVSAAEPPGEGGWLDAQLAWMTAWSQRMHEQIASAAAGSGTSGEPAGRETGPPAAARPAGAGRRTGHGSAEQSRSRTAPRRCNATTAKGGRCKLPAEPAEMTCAIHATRAHH